jgi:hypothetical protein
MLFDNALNQWSSNWDMHTLGGKVRYLRGYTKTSYGVRKIRGGKNYFAINTE